MAKSGKEKRRYPRVYFGNEVGVTAEVQVDGRAVTLAGSILNISVGGMQFSFKRPDPVPVATGDNLTLQTLRGMEELAPLEGVSMEVRWVLDHEFLNHVAVGCAFADLEQQQRKSLQSLVDAHLQATT